MFTQQMKPQKSEESGCTSIQIELRQSSSCCTRPAWLLSTLADVDQKIRILVQSSNNDQEADTFAQRAECYYQQRPQLLSLLLDLYNAYLSLAERYCHSLHKHHSKADHRHQRAISFENSAATSFQDNPNEDQECQSDAESSLSYQLPSRSVSMISQSCKNYTDEIVLELVVKSVDYDIMAHELGMMEIQSCDSARKIELQRSLLEVLESERLILLNENAGLRYKVEALINENKGLASESMFMKRKAGELARCVLKMREDHRVCMLTRKIEELTRKIYGLEKKNQEYHQQLSRREKMQCCSCKKDHRVDGYTSMGEVTKSKDTQCVSAETGGQSIKDDQRGVRKKSMRISKFWDKFKNSDLLFLCRPHPSRPIDC